MQAVPKVQYLPCQKQGFHYGQLLNMLCLEPDCQNSMLCCCACVEQMHKKHNTKPLRLVLLEASTNSKNLKPTAFNIDIAVDLINTNLKVSVESIRKYKENITKDVDRIQNTLIEFHNNLIEQVQLKNIDPKAEIQKAFQIIQAPQPDPKHYTKTIKRLADLLNVKKEEKTLSEEDIINSLKSTTKELSTIITKNMDEVNSKLTAFSVSLEEQKKKTDLWKASLYKFAPEFKHPDIKIISDMVVKSSNSSGYKFAVMQPSLEDGQPIKEMAFKIKESHSNWVAVGMCHKNIVKSKNYGFNFSSIGHGAYMISANGGSWSNIKADQNNTIKSFDFKKDDIIAVQVNFSNNTINFKRNNNKHTLSFNKVPGDELCPCVLFYYLNDEVEFLPNHKF